MSKLQDSLSKQLLEIQQTAQTAEQTAIHKNAEVQAAQKNLDELDITIQHETDLLIEKQKRVIKDSLKLLNIEKQGLEKDIAGKQKTFDALGVTIVDNRATVSDLDDSISAKTLVLTAQEKRLYEIVSKHKDLSDISVELEKYNQSLQVARTELDDAIRDKKVERNSLNTTIVELKQSLADLDDSYAKKIVAKESAITALNGKLLSQSQEIEKQTKDELLIRQDLADWQQRLEERDRNLRIRELKVEQGEDKLVRNSDLLNL